MSERDDFMAWVGTRLKDAEIALHNGNASVNGKPRDYTLRVTQVCRREEGEWKVAHRHADTLEQAEKPQGA